MSKKKQILFQMVMIVFIFGIVFLSAVLNAYAFRNSCVDADAENTAVILSSLTERVEYGLKYGRDLGNYYGIEDVFDEIFIYCGSNDNYIVNGELEPLYGIDPPEELADKIELMKVNGETQYLWMSRETQHIVLAIRGREGIDGYIGILYPTERAQAMSLAYVKRMYFYALIAGIVGALLFELLFHLLRHSFARKSLRRIVMATILVINIGSILSSYVVLSAGYRELASDVVNGLLDQSAGNMEGLLAAGVRYSDIRDMDAYFQRVADSSAQVSAITLTSEAKEDALTRALSADGEGEVRYLTAEISSEYVGAKVRSAVINVIVTTITSMMIALEILIFLIDLLLGEKKERRKLRRIDKSKSIESIGIVRGLSFCFAGFRFMAVAFMSIVLAEIYRPVVIFGYQVPYEILMTFPLSAQVFISMITSYLSGIVIHKRGWKVATIGGVVVMCCGTLASSFAYEPVSFILAQMLIGTGLGFAKMGIDIYAVAVSSEADMSAYTAASNASIIVGYSCAASLGALIASVFGYAGAYLVMTGLGILAIMLLFFFGINVVSRDEAKEEEKASPEEAETEQKKSDFRFPAYIMFIIIPYFFIMMFTDYFFPVYANSVGITTDVIGYVMLAYGIATAYIGTKLCPVLTKRASSSLLMPLVLLILAASFMLFSIHSMFISAALIVVLIGIADGIMPSLQFLYVYTLPFAQRVGFSKALGVEGFFSNMIGAIAPVIFGIVMLYGNSGLGIVAILIAISAVLFAIMNGIVKSDRNRGEGVAE
ncbi:MAG: MFS transporter [Lachnospiraceae bacterium]|nr:MFS transporter [Lachnospiraceae bacterium]